MMTGKVSPIKYIDPLIDFAFKKIFGNEPNKDLLIAFLNEALRGKKCIVDLIYNQNEHPGALSFEGGVIFDLLCTGDQGEQFIIEVQRGKQENFKQRALFYASRLISDQAPRGKEGEGIILEDSPADNFIQNIYLCNDESGKIH